MSGFVVDPIFTASQGWWFAGFLAFGLIVSFVFSPRRRAALGSGKFLLASALVAAPAIAGVTVVRGAYRLGYLAEGRGFFESNMRSLVWMSGSILLGQLVVRYVPPMSWLACDLRRADAAIWRERLGRWFGGRR